ncbi:hypothetical protein F2P81_013649 [Scophthalmus maximus]|uniref:Uncharacterized protein n=1 Tax=Scophthalmus maximus TaxID=52904 RepID=A0A6A4SHG4_SCOMX|nr:hypothetical protein F2P81_013649 [Scophthalmus maximus]
MASVHMRRGGEGQQRGALIKPDCRHRAEPQRAAPRRDTARHDTARRAHQGPDRVNAVPTAGHCCAHVPRHFRKLEESATPSSANCRRSSRRDASPGRGQQLVDIRPSVAAALSCPSSSSSQSVDELEGETSRLSFHYFLFVLAGWW